MHQNYLEDQAAKGGLCPHLKQRPANLIVSSQQVSVAARPSLIGAGGTVTILGEVTHRAWVKDGEVIDWDEPDEGLSYEEISEQAIFAIELLTNIRVLED